MSVLNEAEELVQMELANRDAVTPVGLVRSLLDDRLDVRSLIEQLKNSTVDWMEFSRFAGDAYVTSVLSSRFSETGIAVAIPSDVLEGFALVHSMNAERNLLIRQRVRDLTALLNSVGISPIPLKGVALVLDGSYPDPGHRIMRDMDLLIHADQIPEALDVLARHGYVQRCNVFDPAVLGGDPEYAPIDCSDFRNTGSDRPEHHLPGIKTSLDDHVRFELHTRVTRDESRIGRNLNELAWSQIQPAEIDGVQYNLLSSEYHLLHTLQHAFVPGDALSLGYTDYRHLIDAEKLLTVIVAAGRVEKLRSLVEAVGFEKEFTFFLWQAEDIFGVHHLPQWKREEEGIALVDNFRRMNSNRSAYLIRKFQLKSKKMFLRFFTTPFLTLAYGPLPFYRSLPLYLRYLFGKFIVRTK